MKKYRVTGIDATTGKEMKITIDADDITHVSKFAMDHGILAHTIDPITESDAPAVFYEPYKSAESVEMVKYTYLIDIFKFLGWVVVLASAVCVCVGLAGREYIGFVGIGISGILTGLTFLAISRALDYLEYSAQRLKDIVVLLQKQSEK